MILYDKYGLLQVAYRPAGGYILFDWTSFMVSLEEIQQAHRSALAGAQQHDCWFYLANTSKVRTVLRPEILEWWGKTWIHELATAGLRAIVTVVPAGAIATLSARAWQAEVTSGIVMQNTKSFDEAEAAIQQLRAASTAGS